MSISLNWKYCLLTSLFYVLMNYGSGYATAGDQNHPNNMRPPDLTRLSCVALHIQYPEIDWALGLMIEKTGPHDLPSDMYVMAVPQEHIRHALTCVDDRFILSLLRDRRILNNYVLAGSVSPLRRDIVAIQSDEMVRQMQSPLYLFDPSMHPIN